MHFFYVLFHSVLYLEASSKLLCIIIVCSIPFLYSISLYGDTIIYLSILLMNCSGGNYKECAYGRSYTCLLVNMDTFLLGIYWVYTQERNLLSHRIWFSVNTVKQFFKVDVPISILKNRKNSNCFISFPILGIINIFMFNYSRGYAVPRTLRFLFYTLTS